MENGSQPLSAMEICRRQKLPKKYIEHLFAGLKAHGFISSIAGSRGGYSLAVDPQQIDLYQIMQAVDDTTWEPSCNVKGNKHCLGSDCELHEVWDEVSDKLRTELKAYSLQRIYEITKKEGGK